MRHGGFYNLGGWEIYFESAQASFANLPIKLTFDFDIEMYLAFNVVNVDGFWLLKWYLS